MLLKNIFPVNSLNGLGGGKKKQKTSLYLTSLTDAVQLGEKIRVSEAFKHLGSSSEGKKETVKNDHQSVRNVLTFPFYRVCLKKKKKTL